jgi:lipopolysaccharide transport system permease protein
MDEHMDNGTVTVLPGEGKGAAAVAEGGGEEPRLTIRATKGMAALNLRETWQFRDLLWTLAARDIKLRYKQTVLGVIWVVLQPLVNAGIFTFIIGTIANIPSEGGITLFWYIYAGMQTWLLFAGVLGRVSGCLVGNGHLISKVFFPRFVLPLSIIPSVLLDFSVAMLLLVIYIGSNLDKVILGWPLLLLPLWIGMLIVLALGIGLWMAALMVSYRDVNYVLPVATQFLMFASGVMIPLPDMFARVEGKFGHVGRVLFELNPVVPAVQGFRWSVFGVTSVPEWWAVASGAGVSLGMLVAGAFMFKRMERAFSDVI